MANGGRDQIAEVAEKYRALRGDYEVMGRILTAVLRRMTAARGISAIVDARAKAIDSLIGKILRKPYSDPLEQLTDLCGARVVTDALSHVQPVCDYIRRHFAIDEANCVDKLATLGDEKFGYLSVHLIVSFRPGEFGELVKEMAEQERDREAFLAAARRVGALAPAEGDVPRTYSAEVQVRTVLQHAWAAIGHDRIYKSTFEVPEPLKRRANRLSAVLEEADEDLDRTIADIDAYRAYYGAYMTTAQMRERVRQLSITLQYAEGPQMVFLL